MAVGEEQVKVAGNMVFHKMLAQEAQAGTAVNHDSLPVGQHHFHAGGIAAELQGLGPGSRDGTPGAPEFNLHMLCLLLPPGVVANKVSR